VELLNFVFTSYYQPFLIYLFASPIKYAYQGELNTFDYALVALWVALWLGEVVADEQQWAFQTKKYEYLNQGKKINQIPKPYSEGFITSGLFKISRHPNFFCEISLWWVIFAFSFNSYGLNICVLGAVLLNLLFLGSTSLTEQISCAKYPKYLEYQKQVSRLVPFMIIPSGSVKGDKEN
jgi:steroid 5-alpha reductase family enzyme